MNKAEILANINTKIDDGGDSTALEVREVLGTDTNSLLEAVYGDAQLDSQTDEIILHRIVILIIASRLLKTVIL